MKKRLFLLTLPIFGLAALLATSLKAEPGSLKILKFEADWCGVCRKMKPVFASVARSYHGEVAFQSINVDEQVSLADSYKVELLPTFVAVKNGKVVGRTTGYMSAAKLKSFVNKHK